MGLNSDDFMKLFIAQLQHQDPLSPQDPTQFLGQLAQLTQVEQAYDTNAALQSLITAQNNATALNSVSFIGKNVTANGNTAVFDGSSPSTLQFSQSVPTATSTVTITDATGKTVRTATVGALSAGNASFTWDGRDNNGALLPAGAYNFAVAGTTASGSAVSATTYTTGRIDGITLVNGTPALTIGSATVAMSDIISVKGV
jgi:flagellar basal-body rod modification protein FlgD